MSKSETFECPTCGNVTRGAKAPKRCEQPKCNGLPRQVSPEEPEEPQPKKSKRAK